VTGVHSQVNASQNLAGEPPVGNTPALCYQTSADAGDAACEKNCVVYGGSGNGNGTFTLPASICQPSVTGSDISSMPTPTSTSTSTSVEGYPTATTIIDSTPVTTSTYVQPTATGGNGGGVGGGNGTCTTCGGSSGSSSGVGGGSSGEPTKTPVQPTTTSPTTVPTAGASANKAGGVVAALGLLGVYLL